MPANYQYIADEHRLDYGRKLTLWAQDHLANRYSDRTHFIFELLQNAEDALAERGESSLPTSVAFSLKPNGFEARHFGKPFSPENVKSICAINESTKKDELTEIGRFGIGFKSVYAFTKRPEIHSVDEHFAIEDFVLPVAVAPRSIESHETLFWIPFLESDILAVDEVSQALLTLGSQKLLFLKTISEISWSLPDGSSGVFLKNPPLVSEDGEYITLLGEVTGELVGAEENWLLFSRSVFSSEGRPAGRVEIAFMLNRSDDRSFSVQEAPDSKLVAGFLLQGPYRTTPSRDNVPHNDAWNRHLVEETADLLIHALESLRQKGMLGVDALGVLPIDVRLYPQGSMFRPIFDRVREALKTQPFLPAFKGGHVPGAQAKLARSEALRELLSPSQLTNLLSSDVQLNWLSDEITKDRASELRAFLRQQVGVEELVADSLPSYLTLPFFEIQSDEWITTFYEFLGGQKAVVRELLRKETPFIRCENGMHVPPRRNGQPQAFLPTEGVTGFLTVKRAVCRSSSAVDFLRSIDLSEPDPVDDVVQNVLCNYSESASLIHANYDSDLRRILNAFSTDSDNSRRKLVDALRRSSFVRAIETKRDEVAFLKPGQVYRATQRMKTVFSGVPDVWLVDDGLPAFRGEAMRDLLQACGALDVLRTLPSDPELTPNAKQALRVKQGNELFTWDRISDESDCPDVAAFLELLRRLDQEEAVNRSIEFWLLLRETLRDRREAYFQAHYAWGFGQRSWTYDFPAAWVRRLRRASWIVDTNGVLRRPEEVCFSELHENIRDASNPFLSEILGFRPEAIKELAEKEGIDLEALNLLKRHNISADQLRKLLGELGEPADTTIASEEPDSVGPHVEGPTTLEEDEAQEQDGQNGGSAGARRGEESSVYHLPGGGSSRKVRSSPRDQFHTYVATHTHSEPDDDEDLSEDERHQIEAAAIAHILQIERTLQGTPTNNPGFDLFEGDSLEFPVRFVEVKSKRGAWSGVVALSDEQFHLADIERERYWLYVVEFAEQPDKRYVHRIQDPAGKARHFTYDSGWKALAETSNIE